jgi:hypothetical protein
MLSVALNTDKTFRAIMRILASLAFLGRMGNKRRIELLHLGGAALRAFYFAGFMFLQRQDHQ